MKHALVAGGAGFIGSHLCDLLLDRGYRVTALDSLITGRIENLKDAQDRGLKLIEADITKPLDLEGALANHFDEIYNLASPASPVDFSRMPTFILQTAAIGHRQLLDLARQQKARIFFASTSEVYGDPLVHPQNESYFGNVNPIGHRSCYDEAKRFAEAMTYAYRREFGLDVRVGRIFNTYGPRMRPDDGRIIPNFFMQGLQSQALSVYGDGSQTRSFCYVSDLVEAIFLLTSSSESLPVNIGNPTEHTVMQIANEVNRLTANKTAIRSLPLPENDPKQRKPDISKALRVFGWKPKVDLAQGLEICHEYFKRELAQAGQIKVPVLGD